VGEEASLSTSIHLPVGYFKQGRDKVEDHYASITASGFAPTLEDDDRPGSTRMRFSQCNREMNHYAEEERATNASTAWLELVKGSSTEKGGTSSSSQANSQEGAIACSSRTLQRNENKFNGSTSSRASAPAWDHDDVPAEHFNIADSGLHEDLKMIAAASRDAARRVSHNSGRNCSPVDPHKGGCQAFTPCVTEESRPASAAALRCNPLDSSSHDGTSSSGNRHVLFLGGIERL